MIQFSEAAAIGLHVMIYIANNPDNVHSLKEIAEVFKISDNHLSKVLQRLVKAGYLVSTKGPKGGFSIVKEKKNAALMEIYEVIEGKYTRKNCLFASRHITSGCCIMKPLISSINETFENFMYNNKISDFKL